MQIFLVYDNKRFRLEYNDKDNLSLQVNFLFSQLPKADQSDELKEYILIGEDEVFKKEDYINMQNYNNKELFFIFPKKRMFNNKDLTTEDQKTLKNTKKSKNLQVNTCSNTNFNSYNTTNTHNNQNNPTNDKLTMAQMIKKITNAKEEMKIAPKKIQHNLQSNYNYHLRHININDLGSSYRVLLYPSLSFLEGEDEYSENESQFHQQIEDYVEDSESDLDNAINVYRNQLNLMDVDESQYSSSDLDLDVSGYSQAYQDHLGTLIAMGFNADLSGMVLRRCGNRIEHAIELLSMIG